MSSRTSSRSTLTMVPSTMSPSLKYLIVASIAARKSSSEPMSLTATCGASTSGRVEMLLVIREVIPWVAGVVRTRAEAHFTTVSCWSGHQDYREPSDSERESTPSGTQATQAQHKEYAAGGGQVQLG